MAYINSDGINIDIVKNKLCALRDGEVSPRKLETILKNPQFISLNRIDKHLRLHEIVDNIKDKDQEDVAFQTGYDEAIEIIRSLSPSQCGKL